MLKSPFWIAYILFNLVMGTGLWIGGAHYREGERVKSTVLARMRAVCPHYGDCIALVRDADHCVDESYYREGDGGRYSSGRHGRGFYANEFVECINRRAKRKVFSADERSLFEWKRDTR